MIFTLYPVENELRSQVFPPLTQRTVSQLTTPFVSFVNCTFGMDESNTKSFSCKPSGARMEEVIECELLLLVAVAVEEEEELLVLVLRLKNLFEKPLPVLV